MKRFSLLLILWFVGLGALAQLNTERMTQVGRNALYYQDYVLAIRYFNQVIDAKPWLAEPYYLRAIAKFNLEDYVGAEQDATLALDRNPFIPDAWEVRGVVRSNLQRPAEAVGDYAKALELLPLNRNMMFNKALAQEEAGMTAAADSTYTELIEAYPGYGEAYVGRAQLLLHQGDTIAATADLDKALSITPGMVNALVVRSSITKDRKEALQYMEQAVRQQPDRTWLRINRAVCRYHAGDLNGALEDFDYVLEVEPMNYAALYNRAMLRMELRDNDRAVVDLNRIIALHPEDLRARYNRAVALTEKREWNAALDDANAVVKAYPDMYAVHALRAYINHSAGRERAAIADATKAMRLAERGGARPPEIPEAEPKDDTVNRFRALQTIDQDAGMAQNFNAEGLRGRVQDRQLPVEMQPLYELSYYIADESDEISSAVYVREVEEINKARVMPYIIFVTNNIPQVTRESDAQRHFASIERLDTLIASGNARPIDRLARAMDYITVRDYQPALADLDAVIAQMPDVAALYLLRANTRAHLHENPDNIELRQILADYDQALAVNPRLAVARFNRGTILLRKGDWAAAIVDFDKAIELEPNLGPAWFNRGYARFSSGDRTGAINDISRAASLGIHSGYSLLKLMSQ